MDVSSRVGRHAHSTWVHRVLPGARRGATWTKCNAVPPLVDSRRWSGLRRAFNIRVVYGGDHVGLQTCMNEPGNTLPL